MTKTKIEWADRVWNPVTGCSKVSEGCRNCYAERLAKRFWGEREFTEVQCHEERLGDPMKWKKPARIFVNSMSDLFHHDVPIGFIAGVWSSMLVADHHTFIVLTKRPKRMLDVVSKLYGDQFFYTQHLPNVWLGVSAEDQQTADERIPLLLETPAAKRVVSIEPALGPVDIGMSKHWPSRWVRLSWTVRSDLPFIKPVAIAEPGIYRAESNRHGALSVMTENILLGIKPDEFKCLPKLDWVIMGGESGPNARAMHPDWAKSVRDQCQAAGVPFFFKQWGEWALKGAVEAKSHDFGVLTHEGEWFAKTTGWNGRSEDPDTHEAYMVNVGKKNAGRLLDGREWNEVPE